MLKKAQEDPTRIDDVIKDLADSLLSGDPETDTYQKMVSSYETLYNLRNGNVPKKTELSDWIPVIGSTVGIVIFAVFEAHGHTIVSKGLSLVPKLKS